MFQIFCMEHSSAESSCDQTQLFCIASQPLCLIGTLKDLAPMLRGYPLSIGVISGINRANSFATHPPDFYGMLGLFVPPALPIPGIVLKLGFSSAWCSGHQLVFDGHVPLSQCRHRGTQRAECRNICAKLYELLAAFNYNYNHNEKGSTILLIQKVLV